MIYSKYPLKVGQEVEPFPPIQNTDSPYATEAAMHADQSNQLQGYGYLVTDVGAFIYLGTVAGTAADYEGFYEKPIESKIPFITKWSVADGETITLPVGIEGVNDIRVDWGDGTINTEHSHTYTTAGVKTISILGVLEDFRFDNTNVSKGNLIEIVQWGDIEWENINFYGCINLATVSNDIPDFLNCVSLENLFRGTGITIAKANTLKKATNVSTFLSAYRSTPIDTLEQGLFDNAINMINAANTFNSTLITTLPDDLFKYNNKLTSIYGLCNNVVSLTSINESLLSGAISLINIGTAFRETSITTIPEKTFWACGNLRSLYQAFYGTDITSMPKDLFKYSNLIDNFTDFARGTGTWSKPVPPFWIDFPNAIATNAFTLGTFSNQSEIPVEWGGTNTDWATNKGTVTRTWTGTQYAYDNVLPQAWKDDTTVLKFII